MTRITGGPIDPSFVDRFDQPRRPFDSSDEHGLSSRGSPRDANAGFLRQGLDLGQDEAGSSLSQRQSAFAEKVRHALVEATVHLDEETPEASRVLALAGAVDLPREALGRLAPVEATVPPALAGTQTAARVEALSERIEQAWLDELRLPGPKPSTLRLEFADGLAGLKAVTVAVSPDRVDVTLTPDGPERGAEYAGAAQGLADRLQARFPGRTIRILEAETSATDQPSRGFDDISRLFQRSDRTS